MRCGHLMRTAAVILMCWILSGCGMLTGKGLLSQEQAIAAAVQDASMSRPEVSEALVTPQNIRAEQMQLGEALKLLPDNASMPPGADPQTPVWVVTVDGLWADEMEAPGITATQVPYRHYLLVLDAVTGMEIASSLRP
jgi:hypothetical protein